MANHAPDPQYPYQYEITALNEIVNLLGGGGGSSDVANNIGDSEMVAEAHISHFGALKTSGVYPVLRASFPGSAVDASVWSEVTANGGAVTVGDGVGRINTGTNSAGSAILNTVRQGIFEAGQVTTYQSGVYAGVPVADNIRRWGLMDATNQNGLFFELNGLNFRVVARKAGTDTAVDSSAFNAETTFTPGASNNTYRIFYSAGRAIFFRAANGRLRRLHTMIDSDLPLVDDLDLGLYYENTNTGNTTDVELRVRGASSSLFGELPTSRANDVITDDSVCQLVKAVLTGEDEAGVYRNTYVNDMAAMMTIPARFEIARGNLANFDDVDKFGRNPDVDIGVPEDAWLNGGDYSGQPANATPELVEVFSSSVNDNGTTSPIGSGASQVTISGLRTAASTAYESETIVLNGTTAVNSVNTWYRINRIFINGPGGTNAGTITARHATTTASTSSPCLQWA